MICNSCTKQFSPNCHRPNFGEIVECSSYANKYNRMTNLHSYNYKIPYNYSLNTRKGFKIIYYLMKLTCWDMIRVLCAIIKLRESAINDIIADCNKIDNENKAMLKAMLS